MVYVEVVFKGSKEVIDKEFQTPYNALRFMYMCRGKGHIILSYRADDPFDYQWLEKRFKLL